MSAPKEFVYSIRFRNDSAYLHSLDVHFNFNDKFETSSTCYHISPTNGMYVLNCDDKLIDLWCTNSSKHGFITLAFKSKDDFDIINKHIANKTISNIAKIKYPIFRYSVETNQWYPASKYSFKGEDKLLGYDSYFQIVEKDLNNMIKYKTILDEIGESKSYNYLLYGAPGCGKTTFVRSLASKHNMPIFIVNPNGIAPAFINNILNPAGTYGNYNIKLVLFEDFDRFLGDPASLRMMSSILNVLDGLDDSAGIVRFFSGNNCDVIFNNAALINRMTCKLKFDLPSREILEGKLLKLIGIHPIETIDKEKVNTFIELITNTCPPDLTVRPFVNYVKLCYSIPSHLNV